MAELTTDQAKAGREYGLPDALASRLQGDTYEAVAADAQGLADSLRAQAEADVPEHVKLARAAIAAAEGNPNIGEMQAMQTKKVGHDALAEALVTVAHYPEEQG